MIHKTTLYAFLKKIIPSSIFDFLKKSSMYRGAKKIGGKFLYSDFVSSWQTIKAGPLQGRRMFLDPHGSWQKEIIEGKYDDFFFEFLKSVNLEGKVVYDVGVHIGVSTMYFAERVTPAGKVISFEPHMLNLERTRKNLEENNDFADRVILVNKAISDTNRRETFVFSNGVESGTSSGSFLESADTLYSKAEYEEEYGFKRCEVEVITLDSYATENPKYNSPALIKIDIEGGEYLALQGAKNILKEIKPLLLIEIHSELNMNTISQQLSELNYEIKILKKESDGRLFISAQV